MLKFSQSFILLEYLTNNFSAFIEKYLKHLFLIYRLNYVSASICEKLQAWLDSALRNFTVEHV